MRTRHDDDREPVPIGDIILTTLADLARREAARHTPPAPVPAVPAVPPVPAQRGRLRTDRTAPEDADRNRATATTQGFALSVEDSNA
ncbi:hypothetical protein ACWEQL_35655 [Kitasatospora sp. NPDC004240]